MAPQHVVRYVGLCYFLLSVLRVLSFTQSFVVVRTQRHSSSVGVVVRTRLSNKARSSGLFAIHDVTSEAKEQQSTATETETTTTTATLVSLTNEFKNITPTDALKASIDSCSELRDAILYVDLSEWSRLVGKIPLLQMALERHPLLMARAFHSKTLHTIESLLTDKANVTEEQFQKKFSKESLTRKRVRQLLCFLESKLDLSMEEINKIISSQPKLFSYKVQRFEEVVTYLQPVVGNPNVKAMVKRWPILLTYSIDGRIQPGIAFLQSLGESRWERVLLKYPQVLTHSVDLVLCPKLEFLQEFLNIPTAKQLVTHYPPLLWLSRDLLELKFQFLRTALDLTKEETEMVIETYPQILGLSVMNNLDPTISFLKTILEDDQLRDFVLYQPALLAYSLENRIRPRIAQMKEVDISFAYAPAYLMSLPDVKFQQWLTMQSSSWSLTSNKR